MYRTMLFIDMWTHNKGYSLKIESYFHSNVEMGLTRTRLCACPMAISRFSSVCVVVISVLKFDV